MAKCDIAETYSHYESQHSVQLYTNKESKQKVTANRGMVFQNDLSGS